MGYKMKGAPMIANTKSHGTNKNYQMSGMTNSDGSPGGPPFLKGLKKMAGNFVKGKGAFGLLNPMGAIASRMGAFGKKKNPQADPNAMAANTAAAVDPSRVDAPQPPVVPADEQAGPVAPAPVDPNAQVDPNTMA